ncbi:hypothetical protein CBR_g22990 [Chara braunii]|uniref:Myb-like domain-containing protein n=1 Tax=Chara braunii TaxID=69332 RepID=A0A388L389_CHABU|nr:hypothetical protein CBR_g22990 [Chara braunii]|eukprot:GBG76774.1 hypothetical protein CBR_g22990 [Chara braunii]
MRFELCSGGGKEASRTFIIDGDRSARGIEHGGSLHTEQSTLRRAAPVTCAVGPSPAGQQHGLTAPSVDRLGGARSLMPACTTPVESGVRDEGTCRASVRPRPTVENITRGVSNMWAHNDGGEDDVGFGDDADEGMREDVEAGDDDDNVPIRPLGKTAGRGKGRGRGGVRGRSVGRGGRGGVSDDAGKSPTYWSAEDQMLLVRCKREQDMHLPGLSHNYGRMKTKEWKWEDMSKRMANAGRPKDADDCMKKWDNLFLNYKKIQRFQNASGRPECQRMEGSFCCEGDARWGTRGATTLLVGRATRFPPCICSATTLLAGPAAHFPPHICSALTLIAVIASALLAVRLLAAEHSCHREGQVSPGTSSFRASVPRRGARGWSQPAEEDNNDDFMTEDDQGEATASAGRESARQRTPDQSASKRMSTPPPEAQQLRVRETWKEKGAVVDLGGEDDESLERRRLRSATQATTAAVSTTRTADDERPITGALPCTPSEPRQRNDGGDGASRQRGGGGGVVADARAAGGEAAGGAGVAVAGVVPPVLVAREEAAVQATVREEGRGHNTNQRDYNIVHETKEHYVAIASGLPPPQLPRSVVVPKSSTRVARIADQSQLQQAISRAAAVENIALRILHGWVFKSGNRPRGYNLAFQYSLESVATDIARAMWYGEEWRNVVSALICAHTIDLNMDLLLWYAGANIEDRPEDDDMAAYQESTVISIAHSFRHRRSVVHAANVVMERLGKAKVTLGVYPDYIPDWAPCGIRFAHDATIKGPEDAKRLDWLGSGPADDDIKGEGKDDA